jgi:hypothetical protein
MAVVVDRSYRLVPGRFAQVWLRAHKIFSVPLASLPIVMPYRFSFRSA